MIIYYLFLCQAITWVLCLVIAFVYSLFNKNRIEDIDIDIDNDLFLTKESEFDIVTGSIEWTVNNK